MFASKTLIASLIVSAICIATLLPPHGAHAQVPDKFTNLKVLPKDISKRELLNNMKSFAMGLGVRCEHCHVGEKGMPLSEFDFASDDKETKIIARAMMQMRDEINEGILPKLGELREHSIEVACVTCHRGQPVPQMLEDVVFDTITEEGVEAGLAKYREYRELYYGGFSYDFRERTLIRVATALAENDPQAAVAVLDLNLEFHPESWSTLVSLGDAHVAGGENKEALAAYEKAFAMQPHPRLKQKIDAVPKDK